MFGRGPAVRAAHSESCSQLGYVASQKVLTKAGFAPDGPADPAVIGGRPGTWYRRDLAV